MQDIEKLYDRVVRGGRNMVNAKGEWLYSNAEIGDALGINPNTIRAAAKRLFGRTMCTEYTLDQARKIKAYFASITPEQEEMRISALFDALKVPFLGQVKDDDNV